MYVVMVSLNFYYCNFIFFNKEIKILNEYLLLLDCGEAIRREINLFSIIDKEREREEACSTNRKLVNYWFRLLKMRCSTKDYTLSMYKISFFISFYL